MGSQKGHRSIGKQNTKHESRTRKKLGKLNNSLEDKFSIAFTAFTAFTIYTKSLPKSNERNTSRR
jgi:hypothetical protein